MLEGGLVDGETLTPSGRTLRAEVADAAETPGQHVVATAEHPFKPKGGLRILRGNLAPDGAVVKVAGHEPAQRTGRARVFEREEDAMHAIDAREIVAGDIVVIRYEGPKGGPGMREMLGVTAASGETCPIIKPRVAPLNRPSVTSDTESPKPCPTIAAVKPSISRKPA